MAARYLFAFIILQFTLLRTNCAVAQIQKSAEIDRYVSSLARSGQFSGVVIASYKGKVVYEKAFGKAVAEFNLPNQLNTRFCIASVTKPMTEVIALRLAEEGTIQLQDKISKWVPDFPNGDKISLEMLMNHTSGIPHRATTPEQEALPHTSSDMLEMAKHVSLEFEPGTKESYSSLGYSVLARVLELASGKTYAALLSKYVFQPAGMTNSLDFKSDSIIPFMAHEYLLEPSKMIPGPLKDYSFIVGAGSVCSTGNDVMKFADALSNGRYGERIRQTLTDSTGRFRDNGSTNAFRCFVMIDKKKGYGFVIVSNLSSGANDLLVRDLPKILQDQVVPPPSIPQFHFEQLPADKLSEYVGAYKFPKFTNHIRLEGNQLISGDSKIFFIGNDQFFRIADYATLTFSRDGNGKIEGLKWEALTATFNGVRQ
jgi:CubicO group peptidase (beta-lactamase class C family)